ncbi:MAG: DUF4910 domain-containing protein [Lachnospiraceae bacterium]|nr:DUF4910 domain-containing protein [Lachnospiraceae bacterium]
MSKTGQDIYSFTASIFPICRSLTGNGVRETLAMINEYISETGLNLNIYEIPTGTQVFDWTIPKEWEIRAGYIEDENGDKIIDFLDNNLHILGYSTPIDRWVDLEELKKNIYTQPEQPDVIPYVTSYYRERYGFCMSEIQKNSLRPGKYHMYIDSELRDGSLTYADLVIQGKSDQEIMITSYICHPSMANNECSGPAVLAELIKYVNAMENRRYTYRFVLNPETIGAITYLSKKYQHLKEKLVAGVVLSCVGDDRAYSIIESRYADTIADKGLKNILSHHGNVYNYSYLSRGSDERQYNAPGIDLPVVGFCRSKYGEYNEYHTSADNMDLVSPEGFQGSYDVMTEWIRAMEINDYYKVTVLCEPQLGKRGLYPTISQKGSYNEVKAMTDFIAYADGKNDVFDISNIIGIPVKDIIPIIEKLFEAGLVEKRLVNFKD